MCAAEAAISEQEAAAIFADLSSSTGLALAVSGGPDSTALLWLAARWRAAAASALPLVAVTVDHGLRPASSREAEDVAQLSRTLGVPHQTLRWLGDKPEAGLQEAARLARYRLLAQAARAAGAQHILTAHTLDDQAETILHRLVSGSGVAGLAGMTRMTALDAATGAPVPASTAGSTLALVRPFLHLGKSRLVATLVDAGVGYADDPSNRDPRFTRVRLRGMLSALAREGLTAERLARLGERAARADAALDWAADQAQAAGRCADDVGGAGLCFDARRFCAFPTEIALRLIQRALAQAGNEGPVELGKAERLLEALRAAALSDPPAPFRRTLAGALVTLARGVVSVARAPARRTSGRTERGRRRAAGRGGSRDLQAAAD